MKVITWISAFRLRTLPLALASIGMGSFLAAKDGYFSWQVFALCAATTIFLQVLSNLANDYGDSVNGADHDERSGPQRAVQSGVISITAMRKAIIIFVGLSLVSGISLLYISLGTSLNSFLFFFGVGVLSILAAITYTAGRKPYGYMGLGDLSVLVFFGIVGVMGSYYLYHQSVHLSLLLPALSCGLFSVAVLNVNNIRDIESDKSAGKYSLPVRIGRANAVIYHWILLFGGALAAVIYTLQQYEGPTQWLFLASIPLFVINGRAVHIHENPKKLDPFLKQMALSTLVFVLLFGLGQLLV